MLEDVLDFEGLGFDMLVFILRDGVWGELALAHAGNFKQTHGGPHEVLIDKGNLLAGVAFLLYVPSEAERRAQMKRALAWFWIDLLNLNKVLVRARRLSAVDHLAKLREHCQTLIRAAEGRHLGLDLDILLKRLIATTRCADLQDMRAASEELIAIHQVVGRALAPTLDLVYPDDLAPLVAEKLHAAPR